ncbi:hypothetical protein CPJ18_07215 [Agrobacterium rosae]|nr:hypothetical protein CPJ18_07215 [Agrobacterium rosae]
MRKNDHDEYWTVFDIFTGLPAEVNSNLMDAVEMEEADDLVDLLNAQYAERRGGTTLE